MELSVSCGGGKGGFTTLLQQVGGPVLSLIGLIVFLSGEKEDLGPTVVGALLLLVGVVLCVQAWQAMQDAGGGGGDEGTADAA